MRAMRRLRIVLAAPLALALGAGAALLLAGGSTAKPSASQALFGKTLLDDAKTTSSVKRLLREGGFVAPAMDFGDVTGDGRSDALVLVDSGGAAGAVALYIFSTNGKAADSSLRVVYRSQGLYRASAEISAGTLITQVPTFGKGDDLCCPAKVIERVYAWSSNAKELRLRSSRERDGPKGAPATTAPAQPG